MRDTRVDVRLRHGAALVTVAAVIGAACADDGAQVGLPATTPAPSTPAPETTDGTAASTTAPTEPATTDTPTTSEPTDSTIPPPSTTPEPEDPAAPRPPLTNANGENEAFSGIGQLNGLGSLCTAFLLDVGPPSGPAYAMTNGHCVGLFDNTSVLRDQPADGATVRFRLFADTLTDVAVVPVATVRYAMMRGTDVAILELGVTRADVIGLASYALGGPPSEGDELRVVGVPVDGIDPGEWVLRGGTCTAGTTTRLVEFEWLWDDVVSTDCAGILGGYSGSPAYGATTTSPRVTAVVNTTTIGATDGKTCSLGQPCEISEAGAAMRKNLSYALPVDAWDACFTPAWDPAAPGCPIEAAPTTVDAPRRAVPPARHGRRRSVAAPGRTSPRRARSARRTAATPRATR